MISISPYIKLLRPINLLTGTFAMVVSAGILDAFQETKTMIFTILVLVSYMGAANAYNDVMDYETDLINRPDRPLVSGRIKKRTAFILAIVLFGLGSVFTLGLNQNARLIAILIALPALILYSKFLKGTPLIGNITVAASLGLAFIFSGAAFNHIKPMIIPALLAFGLTFVRELVKDMADVEGDKTAGIKTYPVQTGLIQSGHMAILASAIIAIGSLIPYFSGYYGLPYLIILVLGVETPLTMIVFSFLKSPRIERAKQLSEVLKFSTIAGLVAFMVDHYVS